MHNAARLSRGVDILDGVEEVSNVAKRLMSFSISSSDFDFVVTTGINAIFVITVLENDLSYSLPAFAILLTILLWHQSLSRVERWSEFGIKSRNFVRQLVSHKWKDLHTVTGRRKSGKALIFKYFGRIEVIPLSYQNFSRLVPTDYATITRLAEQKLEANA
ncbi:MAG: hypothetical protein R8G34_12030 [Paracoccaceae bacterium]|nr:hypothetical protein [Paracoccaceae bacterium]